LRIVPCPPAGPSVPPCRSKSTICIVAVLLRPSTYFRSTPSPRIARSFHLARLVQPAQVGFFDGRLGSLSATFRLLRESFGKPGGRSVPSGARQAFVVVAATRRSATPQMGVPRPRIRPVRPGTVDHDRRGKALDRPRKPL
jgi:hypothetical protein